MDYFHDGLLELALQGSPEPLLIVDNACIICWANYAADSSPASIVGTSLKQFFCATSVVKKYYKRDACDSLLLKMSRLPFGEVRWGPDPHASDHQLQGSALLIRWRMLTEHPQRFSVVSFVDRGRRRSDPGPAEVALKNQQLFINQLIHELRTPLAIASGSLRRAGKKLTLKEGHHSNAVSVEHIHVAQQELKRITRFIDHLSLLTDIDTGAQRWRLAPIPLGRMLEHWHAELSEPFRDRLLIATESNVEHHFIQADIEAFKIVLSNLLDNACRYSLDSTPVLIYVRRCNTGICLYVADWGMGIPDALRDQIFDRFRRLEQHRDPAKADGTGLGLAVTKALLDQMNATISLLPMQATDEARMPKTVFQIQFDSHGLVHQSERTEFEIEVSKLAQKSGDLLLQLKRVVESGTSG
jgi:signal transduction histidine kinase